MASREDGMPSIENAWVKLSYFYASTSCGVDRNEMSGRCQWCKTTCFVGNNDIPVVKDYILVGCNY